MGDLLLLLCSDFVVVFSLVVVCCLTLRFRLCWYLLMLGVPVA